MIKLFRNVRQNLLAEGKTSKYLKYAIGEIILVVIGILIALQVNNWNEIRKSKSKTEDLLDKMEEELILTVKNANHDIMNSVREDSIFKRVLTNKATREDYIDNDEIMSLLTWRFTLNPELDNLKKLTEREEGLSEKYKEILLDIYSFSFPIEREEDAMNVVRVSAEQNTDYINLNFPWARLSDSLSNEKAYQYFLTDENYKNRLYTHWVKCMDYNRIISSFRAEVLKIICKLKIIREGYSPSQLEAFLKSLDQKPLEKLGLKSSIEDLKPDDQTTKSSLVANFTKDTLNIIMKDRKGDILWSRVVVPGKIYGTRLHNKGLQSDQLNIFEVYNKDVCIEKYKEVQNGYLFIK